MTRQIDGRIYRRTIGGWCGPINYGLHRAYLFRRQGSKWIAIDPYRNGRYKVQAVADSLGECARRMLELTRAREKRQP